MSINALGVYLCYKYAAETMMPQGRGGSVIATSVISKQGNPSTVSLLRSTEPYMHACFKIRHKKLDPKRL
jgi:NAD(P)-dependent dehydrogenase (short-subunit alcohol dehydrogenase family)